MAGADFTGATGLTVTIPAGATTAIITIPVLNDAIFETPEAFTVHLSAARLDTSNEPLAITDADGTGNIIDDQAEPTVSISDGTPNPATEGTDPTISFTVSLSAIADEPTIVTYSTVNGSAVAGADFTGATGLTVTIPAGATTAIITIPVLNDAIFETPEAFTVHLSAARLDTSNEPLAITDADGTGNIIDDQAAPTVSISDGTPNPAIEGTDPTISFTVSLSAIADEPTIVTYSTVNGSAVAGADFTGATGLTVTIPAGATTAIITIPVLNDAIFETPEAFTVHLSAARLDTSNEPLAITDADGTGNIIDDQAAPTVSISDGTPNPAIEGTNPTISFTVSLSAIADEDTIVTYSTVNGSAVAGADFTGATGLTVTIPAGATTAIITIPVLNDAIFETPEAFTVHLSAARLDTSNEPLAITDADGTGNIIDDQAEPTVSISDGTPNPATEGADRHHQLHRQPVGDRRRAHHCHLQHRQRQRRGRRRLHRRHRPNRHHPGRRHHRHHHHPGAQRRHLRDPGGLHRPSLGGQARHQQRAARHHRCRRHRQHHRRPGRADGFD